MQSLEEMHKIAEGNKEAIDDIKANPQAFIDSCFLEAFETKLNTFFQECLERRIENSVKHGRTSFNEGFGLHCDGFVERLFSGGDPIGCISFDVQRKTSPRIVWPLDRLSNISDEKEKLLNAAEICEYTLSLEAIKTAYKLWLDAIKSAGLTIVHADDFELSEKEYKKLIRKGLFGFGFDRIFNVELSF
jgi:hypothetical protein